MTHHDIPRLFHLQRDHDVTGVSGTGRVANGVLWPDGTVVLRWIGDRPSTVAWASLEDAEHVHGHGGATRIVWNDRAAQPETTGLPELLAAAKALELDRDAASGGESDDYRRGMTRAVEVLRLLAEPEPDGAQQQPTTDHEEPQPAPDGPAPTALRIRVLTEVLGRLRAGSDGDSVTEQLGAATVRSVLAEILADMQPAPVLQPAPLSPAEAADEDAQRADRRETIRVLLARLDRGSLTPGECRAIRERVEAEIREANTARAETARWLAFIERGMDTHMQFSVLKPDGTTEQLPCADWCYACRLERARAAIERVRSLASQWAVLRSHGNAASELRAALDGTEQPATEDTP